MRFIYHRELSHFQSIIRILSFEFLLILLSQTAMGRKNEDSNIPTLPKTKNRDTYILTSYETEKKDLDSTLLEETESIYDSLENILTSSDIENNEDQFQYYLKTVKTLMAWLMTIR